MFTAAFTSTSLLISAAAEGLNTLTTTTASSPPRLLKTVAGTVTFTSVPSTATKVSPELGLRRWATIVVSPMTTALESTSAWPCSLERSAVS